MSNNLDRKINPSHRLIFESRLIIKHFLIFVFKLNQKQTKQGQQVNKNLFYFVVKFEKKIAKF